MPRTDTKIYAATTLTSSVGETELEFDVDSTMDLSGTVLLVVNPRNAGAREVFKAEVTSSTRFTVSDIDDRYLDGSAADSGLTHDSGDEVWSVPLSQHLDDLWDAIEPSVATLASSGAVAIDMDAEDYFTQTLSGDPDYSTTNRIDGSSVLVRIDAGGSDRTPTFPSEWVWTSEKPTTIPDGVTNLLHLLVLGGTAESDVLASYTEEHS